MKPSKTKPSRPKRQTEQEYLALQRLMAGVVMNPLAPGGGMKMKWRGGRSLRGVVAGFIKPNDRLTAFERLEIYNRQYWYRLKDCFHDDYGGLRALLGPAAFEKLAIAYLTENPSRSFTLRNLGQDLIRFLGDYPLRPAALKAKALAMARLEWAHIEAFDNEALPTLETDSLLGADPAKIFLRLQPYVLLLELDYPVDDYLIALKQGERLRAEASNAMEQERVRKTRRPKKSLARETVFLAVNRHNESVYYKRLEPGQFLLLRAFHAGESLAAACEQLAQAHAADLEKVRTWFAAWAGLGWFRALE